MGLEKPVDWVVVGVGVMLGEGMTVRVGVGVLVGVVVGCELMFKVAIL